MERKTEMFSARREGGRICRRWGACAAAVAALAAGGCGNAKQGAVSGAGIGALSGLAIGSLSGNAGKGAATGAILGGVGGAVIGDQNRRRAGGSAAQQQAPAPAPETSLTQVDRDRLSLAKFARGWRVTGWETAEGTTRNVTGTAHGSVENNYFVRLEMHAAPQGQPDQTSNGVIFLGSEPGRGLTMTSRYSTSPAAMSYVGRAADDGATFFFDEVEGRGRARRIVIRFLSPEEFVADVTDLRGSGSSPQASYRFVAD